jgi:hypothetical protein
MSEEMSALYHENPEIHKEISKSVKLSKNELSKWSKTNFDDFFKIYDKCKDDLCIYRDTEGKIEKKILDLRTYMSEYSNKNSFLYYYYITDITGTKKIISFAYIQQFLDTPSIFELSILCEDRNRYKYNGRSIGYELLDNIYDDFTKYRKVLLIEPAMESLQSYYSRWKIPSLKLMPYGYFVYFESCLTDDQIKALFYNDLIKVLKNLEEDDKIKAEQIISKKHWLTRKHLPLEEIKTELKKIIEGYNDSVKAQLTDSINNLQFVTLNQAKKYITENMSVPNKACKKRTSGGKTKKNDKQRNPKKRTRYNNRIK